MPERVNVIKLVDSEPRHRVGTVGHLLDQEPRIADYIKRMPDYERHPGARKIAKARAAIVAK